MVLTVGWWGLDRSPVRDGSIRVRARIDGTGIQRPGTYRLPADSTVLDLVDRAGGLVDGADTAGVPWHRPLHRDTTYRISRSSVARAGIDTGLSNRGPLDLNEATARQLRELRGVGPVLVQRIIEYRRSNGGFDSVEELGSVRGIGPRTLRDLKPKVTVR